MPATLSKDGVIRFSSIQEFLIQSKAALTQGLWMSAEGEWPLRQPRNFKIEVVGVLGAVDVKGEVAFAAKGKVGVQLANNSANTQAVQQLLEAAGKGTAAAPSGPGEAAAPSTAPTAEPAIEAIKLEGTIVATRRGDEFKSAEPVKLEAEALRQVSMFRLITSIVVSCRPLALIAPAGGKDVCLVFNNKGKLVQFIGPDSDKNLIDRLVAARALQREQARSLLGKVTAEKPAEVVVFESQAVKPMQVWNAMRDQAIDAFEAIRSKNSTPFKLESRETQRVAGVSFGAMFGPWMEKAVTALPEDESKRLLEPLWGTFPFPNEHANWPIDSLVLEKRVSRFVEEYLDGRRTFSEALDLFPIYLRKAAVRLVIGLQMIGTLTFLKEKRVVVGDLTNAQVFARELDELNKKTRFDQLSVHWTSHPTEFEPRFKKLQEQFGPQSPIHQESKEGAALCQKRIEMARAAMEFLLDRNRRASYRESIINSFQRQTSAELLFSQAETHLMKSDLKTAKLQLEMAIELDPGRPEYRKKLEAVQAGKFN